MSRLLEKTGTPNRTALVRRALQLGLISDAPPTPPRPAIAVGGSRERLALQAGADQATAAGKSAGRPRTEPKKLPAKRQR